MIKPLNIFIKPLFNLFYHTTPILNAKISIQLDSNHLLETLMIMLNQECQHRVRISTTLLSRYFVIPKYYEDTSIMEILDDQLKYTPIKYKERRNCLEIYNSKK